jgi:hypothetical protein
MECTKMIVSGIIIVVISLVIAFGLALLSPLCVPCIVLFLGLVAGFAAGVLNKPDEGETIKIGALAGTISGIGAALGQVIGAAVNSILVGPEGAARLLGDFGIAAGGPTTISSAYWAGIISSTLCLSLLDIVLMAGFGALGSLAWGKLLRKREI